MELLPLPLDISSWPPRFEQKRRIQSRQIRERVRPVLFSCCTLDQFVTRNWMKQVLGAENDPLGVILRGQRSMRSKIYNRRKSPLWKAYDLGNRPTSTQLNFYKLMRVIFGLKVHGNSLFNYQPTFYPSMSLSCSLKLSYVDIFQFVKL